MNRSVVSSRSRADRNAGSCDFADYVGADWAWEFLRRNRDYVADWRSSVPRDLSHLTLRDGTQLLRLRRRFPRAEKWGLYACADPGLCARQAPIFWHRTALKRVVRLSAKRPSDPDSGARVLADFKVRRTAVITVDSVPLVLLKARGLQVPLEIRGLSVLTAAFEPVYELHDLADLSGQTELLRQLQRFAEPNLRAIQKPPFGSDDRLRHALIALDESLKGKTYRQIAIAIFGETKVAEEWHGYSQFLKDRTRRLVAKGTELMNGGYRDLLG